MFILTHAPKHSVLKITIVGVLSSDLLRECDQAVVGFTARQGPSHSLTDLSRVEAIAVPLSRLASRGRQPQANPGCERIVVAPRTGLVEWVRAFSEHQCAAGYRPFNIVSSMADAYRVLGLTDAEFEPV